MGGGEGTNHWQVRKNIEEEKFSLEVQRKSKGLNEDCGLRLCQLPQASSPLVPASLSPDPVDHFLLLAMRSQCTAVGIFCRSEPSAKLYLCPILLIPTALSIKQLLNDVIQCPDGQYMSDWLLPG